MHSQALPPDHPIVASALIALRGFAGDDIDRATGAIALALWRHARALSEREYRSVLAALPAGDDIAPGSWLSDAALTRADVVIHTIGSIVEIVETVPDLPSDVDGHGIGGRS